MSLDGVFLGRLQFGLSIGFHYLFPPLTIGLGLLMVLMEGLFLRTRNPQYEAMAKFWTKIFALIFAMGVATGIVMEFQFGTNWATYSRYVGDIFGAALAAEGVFAFFLESGFLAVLVFGWDRVSARMHFFATLMVALGSIFSAVWIVVANSWQQTPAGFALATRTLPDGSTLTVAQLTDFWTAVLNHSSLSRLSHVLVGAMIAGGFLVLSVASFYLLRGRHVDFARRSIRIAAPFALTFCVLALVTGDMQGRNIARWQPAKLAAMEGLYRSQTHAPLHLFGVPDDAAQRVRYGAALPGLLSFMVHFDTAGRVAGLDAFPPDERPPVGPTFQAFHLMVGLGVFMLALTALATLLLWRDRLFKQRWLLRVLVVAIVAPLAANELGWITAEIGRQPWIVYPSAAVPGSGLRTADASSSAVHAGEILTSLVLLGVLYAALLATWLYVLDHKIKAGPESPADLAAAAAQRGAGWVRTATTLPGHAGSLTEAPPGTDPRRATERG